LNNSNPRISKLDTGNQGTVYSGEKGTLYSGIDTGIEKFRIESNPDTAHVSIPTSNVERQNLTMRMSIMRFTWLTRECAKGFNYTPYSLINRDINLGINLIMSHFLLILGHIYNDTKRNE